MSKAESSSAHRRPGSWTVNVLCIMGAVVGLAAVFTPWIWFGGGELRESGYLGEMFDALPNVPGQYIAGAVLFVCGTLAAFFSPAAGFLQVVGLVIFLEEDIDRIESYGSGYVGGQSVGFYVGVSSAAIVLLSLLKPIGVGLAGARSKRKDSRWFVFSCALGASKDIPSKWTVDAFMRGIVSERNWLMAILSVVVIAMVLVPSVNYVLRDPEVMSEIQGGVSWRLTSECMPWGRWNLTTVTFNDSSTEVVWENNSSDLSTGSWAALNLGQRDLPSVSVSLIEVDWRGDGTVSLGDSIFLTTQNSTTFSENTVYRLRLVYVGYGMSAFPARHLAISFVFHGGSLDAWISEKTPWQHVYL